MFDFFFRSMKDNLDEVGQLDAPPLKPDGNVHTAKRRSGFPFSPDDKLSSYSSLNEFGPREDYEGQQHDFANSASDTYDAVGNPMNLGYAEPHSGTEVNRGSW